MSHSGHGRVGWGAALLALAGGCSLPAWMHQAPAFPTGQTSWELPLYEPLTQMGPHVLATVSGRSASEGRTGSHEQVLFYVDSGSSTSALPAATFARIGVDTASSRFATVEDAAGIKHSWAGALVPEVRLGDGPDALLLSDVVASVEDRTAILGADVLDARGWEVDLDRGTLRLGGAPWPATPEVVLVATHPLRTLSLVDLAIDKGTVPVLVDTGAPFTVVDDKLLRELGLREKPLAFPFPLATGAVKARLDTRFDGTLALGGLPFRQRGVVGLPSSAAASVHGMLGNDFLYEHAFQMARGALRLRPRVDSLVESAGPRIARWRNLPTCPGALGCLVATPAPQVDGTAHIRLRFVAALTRPWRYLLACVDGGGRLGPIWVAVATPPQAAGSEVEVGEPVAPLAFRQLWARGCARLAVLDVNPLVGADLPVAQVETRFAADIRGLTVR